MAGSLHDELLAIEGIAAAEFEGSEDHPVGVRIQLAAGADADAVGREVQRVLAAHGMRSQMAEERATAPAVAPPVPAGSVVNLSDYELDDDDFEDSADDEFEFEDAGDQEVDRATVDEDVDSGDGVDDDVERGGADLELIDGPPPEVAVPEVALDAADAFLGEDAVPREDAIPGDDAAEPDVAPQTEPKIEPKTASELAPETAPEAEVEPTAAAAPAVAGVGVDEDADRITVTVRSTTGAAASQSVAASPQGLDQAAALAAANLAVPNAPPRVVAVTDATIDGSSVVTVVLESVGGRRVAGASVVTGSRAHAVARAAWAALHP